MTMEKTYEAVDPDLQENLRGTGKAKAVLNTKIDQALHLADCYRPVEAE
jgi:hypothetical protein